MIKYEILQLASAYQRLLIELNHKNMRIPLNDLEELMMINRLLKNLEKELIEKNINEI